MLNEHNFATYLLVDDDLWRRYPDEWEEPDDELEYLLRVLLDFLWCLRGLLSDIDLERDRSWLNTKQFY